ncbi:amino acid/amide ABC transporter ATP-binding protein 1, HAAT family [Desulfobulbus propionicus DSM 2032]|jgi:branched-chain amino acid transport system ATP-binding protein|uniref:Amino acid/amide ABC transporter ATP-binding protein 1, HAAT family n=1 Tax=Desulfobulbus propionicus (strain ATCC 33891 / DSM 2032 / VKM B-1956 / 1pr3) TaxID=577650 RepID=A0A7U3YLS1_DESPD|nr:ABC transporter ATP-binding protein [Desulfobulbus propionicus]ADW17732.1 amino acid/amide ABC transporter ATP-binding protein 1, HAAT family [Desulfobulbus propionicus DSM 2032]
MDPLLTVSGLTMDFGGIRALDHLDLRLHPGEIAALIGPNGAGKTTLFNCLTGIYAPTGGELLLTPPGQAPKRLNGLKPNQITAQGVARTFQNIRLFPNMTVLENVMIGRHCRTHATVFGAIFRPPAVRHEEKAIVGMSLALLERIDLADQADEFAKHLPYGAQRRLEIGRALATEPLLLLLDEPAAGMNPQETLELNELIRSIRDDGTAILLIEHDMKLVMRLSDHIFVLDYGRKIAEGSPEEVRHNPAVIRAYLGEESIHA